MQHIISRAGAAIRNEMGFNLIQGVGIQELFFWILGEKAEIQGALHGNCHGCKILIKNEMINIKMDT